MGEKSVRRLWLNLFLCGTAIGCLVPLPAQGTAATAVMDVARGLSENRPQALWQAMPASYQEDVSGLVHDFASQMDGSLWDQGFSTLGKLTRVLDEKREFLIDHPMIQQQLSQSPDGAASYEALVTFLRTIVESDLSSLDRMRSLNVESFLTVTLGDLMSQMDELSALSPESAQDTLNTFRSTTATQSRSEGDRAWVMIQKGEEEPQEVEFRLVEGKWVPAELADGWDEHVSEMRAKMAETTGAKENTAQVGAMLFMADGVLEQLLAAQTEEQFSSTLQSVIGLAMASGMSQTQQESGPDGNR